MNKVYFYSNQLRYCASHSLKMYSKLKCYRLRIKFFKWIDNNKSMCKPLIWWVNS